MDVAAEFDVLSEVKKTVELTLKMPPGKLDIDAGFESFGLDSIIAMELISNLSKRFRIAITPSQFTDLNTVKDLADLIEVILNGENNTAKADKPAADNASAAKPLPQTPKSADSNSVSKNQKPANSSQKPVSTSRGTARPANASTSRVANRAKNQSSLQKMIAHIEQKYSVNLASSQFKTVDEIVEGLVSEHFDDLMYYYNISDSIDAEENQFEFEMEDIDFPEEGSSQYQKNGDIAIVGISCRFPDAPNATSYWENLINQKNSIREIPKSRWDWQEHYSESASPQKTISKWGALIDDVDCFDAHFFNVPAEHAKLMDPQERLLLQETYKAFQDASIDVKKLAGSNTGVFLGYEYAEYEQYIRKNFNSFEAPFYSSSSQTYYLSNRLSFLFDLCGPSESINTNCASSAVAINRAYYSLLNGESNIAVAGGVSLNLFADDYVYASQYGLLSADGTCGVFDNNANGFTRGEGIGVIILKRLADAQNDNNRIYGVIKACHQNNRGNANSLSEIKHESITRVINECYGKAEINAESVNYIEVDGYSTKWGDSFEFEGIKKALNTGVQKEKHCALGSVKGNIGHLEPASAVASVIKIALSLHHKKFPATITKKTVNEFIDINNPSHPLYIADTEIPFENIRQNSETRIRAGINSFADSGANVHILMEEYIPAITKTNNLNSPARQLFVLSAKNRARLVDYVQEYIDFLSAATEVPFASIVYTSQIGREAMDERLAIIASSTSELLEKLHVVKNSGVQETMGLDDKGIYYGNLAQASQNSLVKLITQEMSNMQLELATQTGKWQEIALLWISGIAISWQKNWDGKSVQQVSLPGYPFAKEKYWMGVDLIEELVAASTLEPQALKKDLQVDYVAPRTDIEVALCNIWRDVLAVERVGITDNFFQLGGNSLLVMRLVSAMQKIGVELLITELIQSPTIEGIASLIKTHNLIEHYRYKYTAGDKIYSIPNRQLLFKSTFKNHWNATGIINIENADKVLLEQSLRNLISEQQGMRHQFYIENEMVAERILDVGSEPILEVIDLTKLKTKSKKSNEIERISAELQSTLDMTKNLFKFVLFECGENEPARFLWIIHHSLIDGYSLSIFFETLFVSYLSHVAKIDYKPLPQTNTVAEWGHYLHHYVNSESIQKDIDYWTSLPWPKVGVLMDHPNEMKIQKSNGQKNHGKGFEIIKNLNELYSIFLKEDKWKYENITTSSIIFTALSTVISTLTKSSTVNFEVLVSGRENIIRGVDLSRTLGWFVDYIPTVVDVNHDATPYEKVQSYIQQINKIPNAGLTFNALKYLNNDDAVRKAFESMPRAELNVNYIPPIMQDIDENLFPGMPLHLITPSAEFHGDDHADRDADDVIWAAYLQIMMTGSQYEFKWMARDNVYELSTVELIMSSLVQEIENLIDTFRL